MDARADAAAGAVAEVVAVLEGGGGGVLGCEEGAAGEAVRVEGVGAGEAGRVVVDTPDVEEYSCAFRDGHAVDGVVFWIDCVRVLVVIMGGNLPAYLELSSGGLQEASWISSAWSL